MTQKATKFLKVAMGAALAASVGLVQAQTIDFSETSGYGVSEDVINIENIRVDIVVSNPFDSSRPQIISNSYMVPFRFDSSTLHLIPDLGGYVDEGDTNLQCASLTLSVSNAFTGDPVPGALAAVGTHSEATDSSGSVTFSNLTAGTASVRVTANGFNMTDQVVTLSCADPASIGLALNPASGDGSLQPSEVRAILTWGENPSDLDSHLTGPDASSSGSTADETNRFHLYYGNRSSCCDVATLDVDDTSSYGPETVTIMPNSGDSTLRAGLYRYSVFHYSGSANLATSDATVRLVFGNGNERTFTPPTDGSTLSGTNGDLWTVFELMVDSSGSVTVLPVNTYSQVSGSSSVRSTNTGYGSVETGVDFARLPAK